MRISDWSSDVCSSDLARLGECCDNLLKLRARVLWADLYAQALSAGRAYARAYGEAKRLAGAVGFDDLIRKTVHLLNENRMAEWIRSEESREGKECVRKGRSRGSP